jgi:hypothetical protein
MRNSTCDVFVKGEMLRCAQHDKTDREPTGQVQGAALTGSVRDVPSSTSLISAEQTNAVQDAQHNAALVSGTGFFAALRMTKWSEAR